MKKILFRTLALLALLTPIQAIAQLEEIVVTAQKREQNLMDIPLAVSAFTGAELNRLGVSDIRDLADDIPTFHTSDSFQGNVTTTLRGIETISGTDPAVAYHVDGVYIPRETSVLALIHDVERMEVLRGPQGTLYGRNATAGAINIVNNLPSDRFEGGLDVTIGNVEHRNVKGVLNIPVTDSFMLRGSFAVDRRDGFDSVNGSVDLFTGQPFTLSGDDSFFNSDKESVRISALYKPNERFSWQLTGEYFENRSLPPMNKSFTPADPMTTPRNSPVSTIPKFKQEMLAVRTRMDWDFTDSMRLSYIAGWGSEEFPVRTRISPLVQVPGILSNVVDDVEYYNHELQLQSTNDGPLQWLVGVFVFHDENDGSLLFGLGFPGMGLANGFRNFTDQEADSYAIYTHNSYAIREDLRFTVGLRYTHDEKQVNEFRREFFGGPMGTFFGSVAALTSAVVMTSPVVRIKDNWDNISWKAGLDWDMTDNTLVYAMASTGYKAGGFNLGTGFGLSFDEENLLSLETGFKSTLLNNRLNLSGTFFYYDYEDFQGNEVVPDPVLPNAVVSLTTNAAAATVKGIEIEFAWSPVENGRLQGFATWLDGEFDSFPDAPADAAFINPPGATQDLTGNSLPKIPDFEFALTYMHTFFLPVGGSLKPSVSVRWKDEHFLRIFNSPGIDTVDAEATFDATLRYDSADGNWYIEGYGKNLSDNAIPITASSALSGTSSRLFNPPRTYGVRAGYNWGGE